MDSSTAIDKRLKTLGIRNYALREELIDHYMTDLEIKLSEGLTEKEAIQHIYQQMEQDQLKKINTSVFMIKYRKKLVYCNTLFIIVLFAVLFGLTSQAQNTPYKWPVNVVKNDITFKFGKKVAINNNKIMTHHGIDLRVKEGTSVYTPDAALVTEVGFGPKRGHYVILKHSDFITRYYHLSKTLVTEGDQIAAGDIIALSGNSGASTGPHLHYEVIKDGKHIDPMLISEALIVN